MSHGPLDVRLFGLKVGHAPKGFGLAVAAASFMLTLWQYRVLTSPRIRELFGGVMRVALDTNCFIDATKPASPAYSAMRSLLAAHKAHELVLMISLHTLQELERKPDSAIDLARMCEVLRYYPIGSWGEQPATWEQAKGTWDDAKRNQNMQQELQALAKSGNDIRDRGAYLDALLSGMDVFVTSDRQLVGSAPAKRIEARFGLRVLTPQQLVEELGLEDQCARDGLGERR